MPFDDERNLGIRNNAAQLLHRFAAGGRVQVLQKRQTGGVNVHGNGKRAGGTHQGHLFCNRPGIPRLYGWNAKPGIGFYRLAGTHHNRGIGAVTGESQDPGIVAGRNQNIIVLQVGVLGAVMQLHGTHRPGKKPGCGNCGRTFPAWCPAHPIRKWCPCSPARSAMRCNCGWQHHPRPWHRDPAPCCGRHAHHTQGTLCRGPIWPRAAVSTSLYVMVVCSFVAAKAAVFAHCHCSLFAANPQVHFARRTGGYPNTCWCAMILT